jgi:hypothetical protein
MRTGTSNFVAGLDDIAIVNEAIEQSCRHLGIAKTLGHSPTTGLIATTMAL